MMKNAEIIAFYLPQYHPIPENDKWYGPGFTEWTNVGKAKPLFRNHYQPLVPADLGYYDLRLPEVRLQQASLAKEAGVTAFCYYHYWFGKGKQLLEMPLKEVVKTQSPDFPFCICWANHTWYKKMWSAEHSMLDMQAIMPQEYPGPEDWDAHFYALLNTFKDSRYYRIDNRLVFVIYHIADIPDAKDFMNRWQELAQQEGLNGFYFMSYIDDIADLHNPIHTLCEKKIVCCKSNISSIGGSPIIRKLYRFAKIVLSRTLNIPLGVYNYNRIRSKLVDKCFSSEEVIPVLIPNWDNTARRGMGAMVLHQATPENFYKHCKDVFSMINHKSNKVVFIKSWNEWGEGNYMEPCIKYGHGYLNALKKAIKEANQLSRTEKINKTQ